MEHGEQAMAAISRDLSARLGSRWSLRMIYHRMRPAGVQRVWHARSEDGRDLAIKAGATPDSTRMQFDALIAMVRANPDSVAPWFIAPDDSFFAMDWVQAPVLKARMQDAGRLDLLRDAGRWLRRLHTTTRALRPRFDAGSRGDLLYPGQGADYHAVIRELAHRRNRLRVRYAWFSLLHGDFHPGNLFADRARVIGFDPPRIAFGPRHGDVANFLVLLRVYRHHALYQGRGWPDSYHHDKAAFLDGYGAPLLPRSARLRFMVDLKTARLWHHLARQDRLSDLERAERAMLHKRMIRRGLLPNRA
ncbi:MAG: phosphotransferase [Paracoccus sp. (in: a-proteobacteria)]|nr:phosphotransferase [Paracoccus sp. (in: a-proteobacteria)]